jgi:hypothetical protein
MKRLVQYLYALIPCPIFVGKGKWSFAQVGLRRKSQTLAKTSDYITRLSITKKNCVNWFKYKPFCFQ